MQHVKLLADADGLANDLLDPSDPTRTREGVILVDEPDLVTVARMHKATQAGNSSVWIRVDKAGGTFVFQMTMANFQNAARALAEWDKPENPVNQAQGPVH